MNRKEFFSTALFKGTALFFAPVLLNSCNKNNDLVPSTGGVSQGGLVLDLTSAANSALNTVGGSVYSGNVIIICTGTSNYIALSKVCTHQGCTITYDKSSKKLVCPCHGAQYSTAGSVLQGPASRPLTTYNVKVDGNIITVS